ncbi:SdpI family protein [Rubricoccus marinus]|nr:SdpI family protein [Rubricoccus marinus]
MTPEARERGARVMLADATAVLSLALPAWAALSRGVGVPDVIWGGFSAYALLLIAPALDPRRKVAWDQKPLPGTRLGIAAVCAVGAVMQMRSQTGGDPAHVDSLLWILILGVLGNAMPSLRPNWFFGVRTPWTLRDDDVWRQTHRVTGHLLLATSAGLAVLWWPLAAEPFTLVATTATGALAFGSILYSWWLWRQRPHD